MSYLALIGGGFVLIYFLQVIWEFVLFRRVMDDPVKGKLGSTLAAYLTASAISFLAGAGFSAFLYYVLATVIVGTFAYRRGMELRENPAVDPVLEDTFS